jgi:leucyl-tRNA synthetase
METVKDTAPYSGPPADLDGPVRKVYKSIHGTIRKVTNDIEDRFHFNTAIAAVMELVNALYGVDRSADDPATNGVMRFAIDSITLLLSPILPHLSEELWGALGHKESILLAPWPAYRQDALEKDDLVIVVQVNGKLRSRFDAKPGADAEALKARALSDERVQKFIENRTVKKVILVPNKLVNIVV